MNGQSWPNSGIRKTLLWVVTSFTLQMQSDAIEGDQVSITDMRNNGNPTDPPAVPTDPPRGGNLICIAGPDDPGGAQDVS